MGAFKMIGDSIANFLTGLGQQQIDKSTGNTWLLNPISEPELWAAYRGDWLVRKGIRIPAGDMVREWRAWQASNDQIEKIEAEEKRLGLRDKVRRAKTMARLLGGCALVMNDEALHPEQPVDIERIGLGGLKSIAVVPKGLLQGTDIQDNIFAEDYGQPTMYSFNTKLNGPLRVHPSRVIRFVGEEIDDPAQVQANQGWGDSSLLSVREAVMNAGFTQAQIASMLQEAQIDVVRVPDLESHVATEADQTTFTKRWQYAMTGKSLFKTLLLDKEEEWGRKAIDLGQMPEMLRIYMQLACGAWDIPATRFLSQAPEGMNSTGESDMRNYYDRLSKDQGTELTPPVDLIDEFLIRSALGSRPDSIHWEWRPLWQMDAVQRATVRKSQAEEANIYNNTGLIPVDVLAKAIRNRMIEEGTFPGIEDDWSEEDIPDPEEIDEQERLTIERMQIENNQLAKGGGGADPEQRRAANDFLRQAISDAAPRTAFVRRYVENADEILAWAASQGIGNLLDASKLHVTIMFSRTPFDWIKVDEDVPEIEIGRAGPRVLERFGQDKDAVVLVFSAWRLGWRCDNLKLHGAASDFQDYNPHITLSWEHDGDISAIEPYQGKIVLGPEVWSVIDEDWKAKLVAAA